MRSGDHFAHFTATHNCSLKLANKYDLNVSAWKPRHEALVMHLSCFWCWFTNSEDTNDYVSRLFRVLHNRFFNLPLFFCNISFFALWIHLCSNTFALIVAPALFLYDDDNDDDGLFIELYCVALVFGQCFNAEKLFENQIFFIDICAQQSGLASHLEEEHPTKSRRKSNCCVICRIMVSHLSRL